MQVCTSLQTDNHASTPPLSFLQAGCPSCRPTNSVKALKAYRRRKSFHLNHVKTEQICAALKCRRRSTTPLLLPELHKVHVVVFSSVKGRFGGFSPKGEIRCTDGCDIWHGGVDRMLTPPCHISTPLVQHEI